MGVPLMLFKGTPKNFFRPFYQAPLWPVTPLHQAPAAGFSVPVAGLSALATF